MSAKQSGLLSLPPEVCLYIFGDLKQVDLYNLLVVSSVFHNTVYYNLYQAPQLVGRRALCAFFEALHNNPEYAARVQSMCCSVEWVETSTAEPYSDVYFTPPFVHTVNDNYGKLNVPVLPNCHALSITSSDEIRAAITLENIARWTEAAFPLLISLDIRYFTSTFMFTGKFPASLRALVVRGSLTLEGDHYARLWNMLPLQMKVVSIELSSIWRSWPIAEVPKAPKGHTITHLQLILAPKAPLHDIPLVSPNLERFQVKSEVVNVWTLPFAHLQYFTLHHGSTSRDNFTLSVMRFKEAIESLMFPVLHNLTLVGNASPNTLRVVADEAGLIDTCKAHAVQLALVNKMPGFDFDSVRID